MEDFPKTLPPAPLSEYDTHIQAYYANGQHDRDNKVKTGGAWEPSSAWGHHEVQLDHEDNLVSRRLRMNYKATSPTLPALKPSFKLTEYINPAFGPIERKDELYKIKESLTQRVTLYRNSRHVKYKARINNLLDISKSTINDTDMDEEDMAKLDKAIKKETQQLFGDFIDDTILFEDTIEVPIINEDYLGGCLQSGCHDDLNYLIHADGDDMDTVSISMEEFDSHDNITVRRLSKRKLDSQILQIHIQNIYNRDSESPFLFTVRARDGLHLLKYESDNAAPEILLNIPLTGIKYSCMSPYMESELVYIVGEQVHMVNNGVDDLVRNEWHIQPGYNQHLKTVHYGAHPRCLILTDPSSCALYDIRSSRVSMELLSAKSNYLQMNEHIVTSCQSTLFKHHILTHHTLLTIDERFNKMPLIYQVIPSLTWACLLSQHRISDRDDVILMGCQANSELFSIIQNSDNELPALSPIWKINKYNEILSIDSCRPPLIDRSIVNNRINKSGLIGSTVTPSSQQQFNVYQLSGCGDMFVQTYSKIDADKHDITETISCNENITSSQTELVQQWYRSLVEVAGPSETNHLNRLLKNVTTSDDIVLTSRVSTGLEPFSRCPICNPDEVSEQDFHNTPSQCLVCGFHSADAHHFSSTILKNVVFDPEPEDEESTPVLMKAERVQAINNTPSTQLYLKLWNNEDISQELRERDELWEKRRVALRDNPDQQILEVETAVSIDGREMSEHESLMFEVQSQKSSKTTNSLIPSSVSGASAIPAVPQQPPAEPVPNQSDIPLYSAKRRSIKHVKSGF